MAFPIPDHLPRRSNPHDISSEILTRISNATNRTLDVQLASSWVNELNETIRSTKVQIHERIQTNLPEFQRQFEACKSVQSRLETLTSNVDKLQNDVADPETGLLPTLTSTLSNHHTLAQEASDAQVRFEALLHLQKCRKQFNALEELVRAGKLPHAIKVCAAMDALLDDAPAALTQAIIMRDIKQKFRALKAFAEEQLNEAWSRGVIVEPSRIIISLSIQVRKSDTTLSLTDILHSLSPGSLSDQLTTLRRNLTTHFIDVVVAQPAFISVSFSMSEYSLTLVPSPPNNEDRTQRVDNLAQLFDFLFSNLTSAIPANQCSEFLRSLAKPVSSGVLNSILVPSLPSSLNNLPEFLRLVQHAVEFEEKYIAGQLTGDTHDKLIDSWGKGVCGHYERQRRNQILNHARGVILADEDPSAAFPVEVEVLPVHNGPNVIPVQEEEQAEESADFSDDAWGFGDEDSGKDDSVKVEDSWGFDDDLGTEEISSDPMSTKSHPESEQHVAPEAPKPEAVDTENEPDPADAWGWNDNEEELLPEDEVSEDTAWDDPWGEPSDSSSKPSSGSPEAEPRTITSPKAATRLEKLASKNKKHINGTASLSTSSKDNSSSSSQVPLQSAPTLSFSSEPSKKTSELKRPSKLTTIPKETYFVSRKTKEIVKIVEDTITEGKDFNVSKLFATTNTGSLPGSILLQSAPSVLDLYRALLPVRFSSKLRSPEGGFLFSNDCLYLNGELQRLERNVALNGFSVVGKSLSDSQLCFKVLSDSWFHDSVELEQRTVDKILVDGTQGFTYTGDQDRYDECESAIGQVLRHIRQLAQRLKRILTKSKYYLVIGQVTDTALSRVLADIIALPDIPELESHKLSELCRILNALEGLFSEDPSQPSFVVAYVPSWLKFSYLSELLEASMADITYLFEEGALVDFDIDELVRLVRALFADSPLRTNTINKILGGHPQR